MKMLNVKALHQTVIHEFSASESLIRVEESEINKWPLSCLNEICSICFLKSSEFAELKRN